MAFIYQHMLGTTEEWENSKRIIPDGEIVIEECEDGSRKIKIGDGKKNFKALDYFTGDLAELAEKLNRRVASLQKQIDAIIADNYPTDGEAPFTNVAEEVGNARVGIDETVYDSLGSHIRTIHTEIIELSESLDDLKNAQAVDGLLYEDNFLSLTANGNIVGTPVEIIGGSGGGGGSATTTRLMNKMSGTKLTVINSVPAELKIEFYEKVDNEFTVSNGTVFVEYSHDNGSSWKELPLSEYNKSIPQNTEFKIPIPSSVLILNQEVKFKVWVVGGDYGLTSNILQYTLKAVEGSITSTFTDCLGKYYDGYTAKYKEQGADIFTGSFIYTYICYGKGLDKTVYFELDGEVIDSEYIANSNGAQREYTVEIGKYPHGHHTFSVYFKTDQGSLSNILSYDILYEEKDSRSPMLAANAVNESINNGDPLNIKYRVYTPFNNQGVTPKMTITVYDEKLTFATEELTDIDTTIKSFVSYDYTITEGTLYVSFTVLDRVLSVIPITIKKVDSEYNTNPVSSGLIYSYKAYTINTESDEKNIYMYPYQYDSTSPSTIITAENTNFNWKSNGFMKDSDASDTYLRLMGPARHTVHLPILTSSYTDSSGNTIRIDASNQSPIVENGRTIEIEFRVSNVSDINAKIIKYLNDDGIGFLVTPVYAALLYKGTSIITDNRTGFIKNEEVTPCAYIQRGQRLRLSFVIDKLGTISNDAEVSGQCVNIYINGEYAQSIPYLESTDMFTSNASLVIGDDSCIVDLYEVRMYRQALTANDILQNYNVGYATTEEKIEQLKENDVLIDDSTEGSIGSLSYYKLRNKYPCVLVTGSLSPNKSDKYSSGFIFTKPVKTIDGLYI